MPGASNKDLIWEAILFFIVGVAFLWPGFVKWLVKYGERTQETHPFELRPMAINFWKSLEKHPRLVKGVGFMFLVLSLMVAYEFFFSK